MPFAGCVSPGFDKCLQSYFVFIRRIRLQAVSLRFILGYFLGAPSGRRRSLLNSKLTGCRMGKIKSKYSFGKHGLKAMAVCLTVQGFALRNDGQTIPTMLIYINFKN